VPLGGSNVTSDIAIGLRTPIDRAEEIKIQHGCALAAMVKPEEDLVVPGVGGRPDKRISRHLLASMIEPRMEEIYQLANREVKKHHYADLLGAGVVITGGSSLMEGAVELAEQVFQMPVRRGVPSGLTGLAENVRDPRHSTGVGLILHALDAEVSENGNGSGGDGREPLDRLLDWFRGLFS
jgi:cell division protein FtsA